jgi:hypothetical protein
VFPLVTVGAVLAPSYCRLVVLASAINVVLRGVSVALRRPGVELAFVDRAGVSWLRSPAPGYDRTLD